MQKYKDRRTGRGIWELPQKKRRVHPTMICRIWWRRRSIEKQLFNRFLVKTHQNKYKKILYVMIQQNKETTMSVSRNVFFSLYRNYCPNFRDRWLPIDFWRRICYHLYDRGNGMSSRWCAIENSEPPCLPRYDLRGHCRQSMIPCENSSCGFVGFAQFFSCLDIRMKNYL